MTWAKNHWKAITVGAVLFFVGIGIGAADSGEKTTEASTETRLITNTETVVETKVVRETVKPPGPSGSIEGDGTFLVGSEIRPGTYRAAPASSGNCYWARLRDLNEGVDSIIGNGNTSGQVIIRVAPSDYAVQTQGCETFERIG